MRLAGRLGTLRGSRTLIYNYSVNARQVSGFVCNIIKVSGNTAIHTKAGVIRLVGFFGSKGRRGPESAVHSNS